LSIPSSQCMTCHMHPGTNMVTTYYGYTWWDNEINAEKMYPEKQHDPSAKDAYQAQVRNPEGSTDRGKWRDVNFLQQVGTAEFNKQLDKTQMADFHSHGWIFRAVYKHDRKGNLLDGDGGIVDWKDPEKFKKAVHLADIHLDKGMQCADCHFSEDNHGNGKLYGETRNALVITCEACHGDVRGRATLVANGPAALDSGINLALNTTPFKQKQFYWRGDRLYQRSIMDRNQEWEVVQVLDTITPGRVHYSEKSRLAKTIQTDGVTWGAIADQNDLTKLAHSSSKMSCQSCHTSWTTSCFGCHLSMSANQRMPMLHNEGLLTRNYTAYDFMVLRDDVYMLGIDGTVTGNRVSPIRSACAVVVSSQNAQRDWLYYQQQTVSSEGFSGQAFSPYVPHTVRAKETKECTDCHVSQEKDNNAWMAQLFIQGTNFLNFMGRYVYVATGEDGFNAVTIAEHQEPPAVYGSDFHKVAYPKNYEEFLKHKRELDADEHPVRAKLGGEEVLDLQLRGEYVYTALGKGGFRIYDVAQIDNKDFSEKIVTAPVSPFGQKFYVKSKYATAIATPTTLGVDPLRTHAPENEEQKIHLMYGFLYGTDKYEGLVVIGNGLSDKKDFAGVGTLLDGNPANNFLRRAVTFNPDGKLNGARRITIAGVYAYILCDRGLEVVSLDDPLHPKITAEIGAPILNEPTGVAVQFRYAFVTDKDGLKVVDVTHLDQPRIVERAKVPLGDARNVYLSRTYAYVSAGKEGIAIVDIERPEQPRLEQMFNAGGELKDTRDIKVGMVSSSQFAFVADGEAGFKVVQLFSPVDNNNFYGFSPRPTPKLIAQYKTKGPALIVSEGTDRDRAVDESGNQLSVFGRRGARPFNLQEMQRMYMRSGELYTVTNDPPGRPVDSHVPLKAGDAAPEEKKGTGGAR
ncbi:MAG TPA: multiheme c-type cytochrome, partial [Terriglobales bacterium]|nr:multiheme c-type cytochrome [Terriglobales bacterium]